MHANRNKDINADRNTDMNADRSVDMNVNFSGSESSQEALQLIQQNSRKMYLHDPLMPDL